MDSPDLRAGPVHQKCASAALLNLQRAYWDRPGVPILIQPWDRLYTSQMKMKDNLSPCVCVCACVCSDPTLRDELNNWDIS